MAQFGVVFELYFAGTTKKNKQFGRRQGWKQTIQAQILLACISAERLKISELLLAHSQRNAPFFSHPGLPAPRKRHLGVGQQPCCCEQAHSPGDGGARCQHTVKAHPDRALALHAGRDTSSSAEKAHSAVLTFCILEAIILLYRGYLWCFSQLSWIYSRTAYITLFVSSPIGNPGLPNIICGAQSPWSLAPPQNYLAILNNMMTIL